ncbi:hypothetical protein BWI93_25295 [Siphonobacter sp. BAB-5385]|nr:hypothetical protein BWI93_25295 [Siphonobacter sp. BAB-5385]
MNAVFFRTLVTEFYRQNSGFFLLILLISFGIIRSDDHVALFRYAMLRLLRWCITLSPGCCTD